MISAKGHRMEEYILETRNLVKEFRGFIAVSGVNLRVRRGSIHALIGPNGAGKTTCFNLLTKFLTPTSGTIHFKGKEITRALPSEIARQGMIRSFQISAVFPRMTVLENVRIGLQRAVGGSFHFWRGNGLLSRLDNAAYDLLAQVPTYRVARLGIGYCPEERGIFSALSCEENLLLPPQVGKPGDRGMSLDEIYAMFPNLEERKHSPGTRLSGGEQQMLAVARILRSGARILLLDEISEGLAPVIVQTLARMVITLKAKGYTVVMVEQNFHFAAGLADRLYVMEHGQIVKEVASVDLTSHRDELNSLLGV